MLLRVSKTCARYLYGMFRRVSGQILSRVAVVGVFTLAAAPTPPRDAHSFGNPLVASLLFFITVVPTVSAPVSSGGRLGAPFE